MKPSANDDNSSSSSNAPAGEKVFFQDHVADLKQSKTVQKNTVPKKTPILTEAQKSKTARPPGYSNWAAMKSRCDNPSHKYYDDYGGRGISYDPSWVEFANFIRDMGAPPSRDHSLDRTDPDGNYEKNNCRWASKKEQARNRRTTRRVDYQGKDTALADLAEERGLSPATVSRRIRDGYSLQDALDTPSKWGGPRTESPLRSEHNGWPPSLAPESKAKMEEHYRNRIKREPELTRPQCFLDYTDGNQKYWIENYWAAPKDDRPIEHEKQAKGLDKARDEASVLLRRLQKTEAE